MIRRILNQVLIFHLQMDMRIKYFIECLKTGKHPEITTPESSAESLFIVKKTIESAKLGQKIKI